MSKDCGLGDVLYLDGRDLSGDTGAISEINGGPEVTDSTHVTKDALERIGTILTGQLIFDAYFNPTGAHPQLAALPLADVVSTYLRGSDPATPCAGLIGRQVDYPGNRSPDGALHYAITVLSDGAGVEWGRGYVGGPTRVDSGPTTGSGVDDGAYTTGGLAAYLHVLAFTGTAVTVTMEHSHDNGVLDAYTTVLTFAVVTVAPGGQRVATSATTAVKRWLRVKTAGTFSALTFHVMAYRGVALGVVVAVDTQIFNATGTWNQPTGCNFTMVIAIAGGNGGGGGACTDGSTTTASGGSGGGGGGMSVVIYPTNSLNPTEPVTVGAGGSGGNGTGTSNAAGSAGGNGGATIFGSGPSKCVALAAATTGIATNGLGGTIGGASGATGVAGGTIPGGQGVSSTTVGAGSIGISGAGTGGGGSGGSLNNPPAANAGGSGGNSMQLTSGGSGRGAAGASGGGAGGNATHPYPNEGIGGAGGGGGGSATGATPGGAGGNGAPHGGAGGGGGASVTPSVSGKGGNGGTGFCKVMSW